MPFGLQPLHILIIIIVALIIFGPRRLPQLGRWIGRTFSEFRKGAQDMSDGFKEEVAKTRAGAEAEHASPPPDSTRPYCTQCGTENPSDARYCARCGAPLTV